MRHANSIRRRSPEPSAGGTAGPSSHTGNGPTLVPPADSHDHGGVANRLPLPTLLSQVLVAYTIEFDNEAEHRLQHRTSTGPSAAGPADTPWLVSLVLWANVLQYLDEEGVPVSELERRARTTRLLLGGLQRWGYLVVDGVVVRLTPAGRRAQEVWRPLADVVDQRWQARFGADAMNRLTQSLRTMVDQFDLDFPAYLPIVSPTQNSKADLPPARSDPSEATQVPLLRTSPLLPALLSGVLHGFTLDVEQGSRLSVPIGATTLRVLDDTGVRVRDLPRLTGVSKEANAMCMGFLERRACIELRPDPSGRGKVIHLTAKGKKAQDNFRRIVQATEGDWVPRFGPTPMARLRSDLEQLVVGDDPAGAAGQSSPLFGALQPYPDGWRAKVRDPATLPHYPMVLHRGGFPDGS